MAKILSVSTHSTDDPARASLAFIVAAGAMEPGKEAAIALVGDGVYVAKESVAKSIHGVADSAKFAELISESSVISF